MEKSIPYARIAITLPAADLAAADRMATSQDRSRSWIIAEAVRRYARTFDAPEAVAPAPSGLGASRLAQLTRDMALTPEARVRLAEETVRLTESRDGRRTNTLVAFDHYEDFLNWQRSRHTIR